MAELAKPMPPVDQVEGFGAWFDPSPELAEWATASFIADGAPLRNPDHEHLRSASIGFLWTNVSNAKKGRMVIGTAEPGAPQGAMGKWGRAKATLQVTEWFGMVPDFIITIDAAWWLQVSDAEACALVEHELYHCAQDSDEYGAPKFNKQTGRPVFTMRGHDVEEFIGVVRRYGADAAGISADDIRICDDAESARAAFEAGAFVAVGDFALVADLPFDVAVEATGHPVHGARHAELAIAAGKHVAMVSKEVDSVVGPGLAAMAADKGVIVTPVDGDQPSLLIGLVTWAQVLGFEIVAAGKSSEYDFVHDPETGAILCNGNSYIVPEFATLARIGYRSAAEIVVARAEAASALPQRAVPDLCEMTVVANACGMGPDRPDLHCPILRIDEVPTVLCGLEDGGILGRTGVLEVFHCLRAPDEISFAGGVFVVIRCDHADTWDMLRDKGHVVSRNGKTAMVFIPRHLLGLEAATSILEVGLLGVSSGATVPGHHIDLVAHADRDLPAGHHLTMGGHHHSIEGVSARMMPAGALDGDSPAPFYLASNCLLARDVAAGELIRMRHLKIPQDSVLARLRESQDARFFKARRSA